MVVNVHRWLARATLDAIGEGERPINPVHCRCFNLPLLASFGRKFDALDKADSKLANNFKPMVYVIKLA